jgi:phenylalanyl-tRNA synthetase alpha chain
MRLPFCPRRVFNEAEWTASGLDSTAFAARELKATLEGLAKHLFGDVECRWLDTYFPFTGAVCGRIAWTA